VPFEIEARMMATPPRKEAGWMSLRVAAQEIGCQRTWLKGYFEGLGRPLQRHYKHGAYQVTPELLEEARKAHESRD
jgi:hypothetical protein